MDVLVGLLDGPSARGAFALRAMVDPPWAIRVQDRAPLTLMAVVSGTAWLVPDDGDPVALHPGDVGVVRGPDPYTVADTPGRAPQIVIHEGQRCTTPDGTDLGGLQHLGVRSWGTSPDGATVLLIGTYERADEVSSRLLAALPPHLAVRAAELASPLVDVLAAEITREEPGQAVVLDRLLDLLTVAVLRTWFARHDQQAPAWFRAHTDPEVAHALRLLHQMPERDWTVASLAAEVGLSRAALARRFTAVIGEPPMSYLTGWRVALAADLLREPGATLAAVARRVGYGSPYALSAAFKRVRGVSPRAHREALATVG